MNVIQKVLTGCPLPSKENCKQTFL